MTDELLDRVERLEQQNKRMKSALAAVCVFLAALVSMGQTTAKKQGAAVDRIEAREIRLIDESGRYITELKPTGLICRRDGVERLDLSTGEIGSALAFKTEAGRTGTMLDESTMVLMNNNGILSMRPEHLFLQEGDTDAFLTATALKIRASGKKPVNVFPN